VREQEDASVDRFLDGLDDRRDEVAGEHERRRAGRAQPGWGYMTWLVDQLPTGRVRVVGDGRDRDAYAGEGTYAEALTQAGRDGWELVNATQTPDYHTLFFKRPLIED
jgi:hypothetical protein